MRIARWLSLVAFVFSCAGCIAIPFHFTVQPGVKGTIVDGQTGIPLGEAHITLEQISCYFDKTNRVSICRTNYLGSTNDDETGRFELAPLKQWAVLFIPGDYFPMGYEVLIERTNFVPVRVGFGHRGTQTGQDAIKNLGVIRLNSN